MREAMNRLKLLTGFEGVVRNNIGDSYLEGRSTEILLDVVECS